MIRRCRLASLLGTTCAAALVGWASPVGAHARVDTPVSRDGSDSHKDPDGPCGVARAVPPQLQATYVAGQGLHVEWTETVSHPGCFVVDFSVAGDGDFQILGVKSHAGAAGGTPRAWNLDVTLPSAPCDDCTLRVRQLMLGADLPDTQCPPASVASGSTYYSCANVVLTASGGDTGGTGGASTGAGPPSSSSGCSYAAPGSSAGGSLHVLPLLALALLARRRRR